MLKQAPFVFLLLPVKLTNRGVIRIYGKAFISSIVIVALAVSVDDPVTGLSGGNRVIEALGFRGVDPQLMIDNRSFAFKNVITEEIIALEIVRSLLIESRAHLHKPPMQLLL